MKKKSSSVMKVLLALATVSLIPATARDRQFSAIVQRVQSHYHRRPMRLMGLVSFVANRAHQAGVKNIKIVVFENLDTSLHPADHDLDAFMQSIAGPEFQPFVRVRSRRDGEKSFIYAREFGKDFELLIVSLEPGEACVIKMKLDPEEMGKWIDDPTEMGKGSAHGSSRAASR